LLHNKTLFMKLRAKLMQKFWQLRSQFLILEDDVVFMGSSSMLKSTTREMIPTIWLSFSQV
jgi:GR25 family glycosyltransferase involved in LPS biosynthesis